MGTGAWSVRQERKSAFITREQDQTGNLKSGLHPWFLLGGKGEWVVRFKEQTRASLVAQRLRICLPMQGTQVPALVWEDLTCRGATGPVSHSY